VLGPVVSGVSWAGWNVSSGVMRYGRSGVEPAAGAPPSESVMSERTIRPLRPHGSVKSSSVPTSTLPRLTPFARTLPSVGRAELCMNMTGWFVPPTPPPATSTGASGVASRTCPVFGSRRRPPVA
jgi:hypothetical protein